MDATMTTGSSRLCILRHGETEENIARILQGHLPGRLTAAGRQQAMDAAKELPLADFDAVVSSDLQRVTDTVRLLFNGTPPCPWERLETFREIDWGSMTGMHIPEVNMRHLADDVETREQLYCRAGKALDYLRRHYAGQTVLVVSHGLFLRSLQAQAEGIPLCALRQMPRLGNCEHRWLEV